MEFVCAYGFAQIEDGRNSFGIDMQLIHSDSEGLNRCDRVVIIMGEYFCEVYHIHIL